MRWRKYTDADYDVIAPWFVAHGWQQAPHRTILPPTGFIIEGDDGKILAGAFLYLTNSPLAFLEWLVTNPELEIAGFTVLKYLIARVKESAKLIGVHKIMHLCKPSYARVFQKKLGFVASESATILFLGVE
jgi:hypothetical protein